ncbi:MAG: ADOP family duplicated permease, partial [Acidobacteriota bacterium]
AEEMRAHLDLYVDELVARGRTRAQAERESRLAFGNPRVKLEEIHQMTRLPILDSVGRDLRYAARVLRRTPAFTSTAIVTLALVIGACTAVFTLADAILLRPLPYPDPDRLGVIVTVSQSPQGADTQQRQDGTAWEWIRDRAVTMDVALAASSFGRSVNLVVDNAAAAVSQTRVSAGYFRVLGMAPLAGREFTPDEDRPGGPAVAVLSHQLWQRLFHGDPGAVGQSVLLRGERYEVVGIMPEAFRGPGNSSDVWTPARPARTGEGGGANYAVIARVRPGHSWADAAGELARLGQALFAERGLPKRWLSIVPMKDDLVQGVREPIQMLAAAVGVVLLIACVNLAALLISRAGTRTKEIATRMAIGSGRAAVVRQLMAESLVLSVAGGALGLLIGQLGLVSLKALGSDVFQEWERVTLDARAIVVTVGLSVLTSFLFGLVPALQASTFDINAALTDGGTRSTAGRSRQKIRRLLVVSEVALGVVLLVIAGLFIRTFVGLRTLEPGFDPTQLTTARVSLQDARYRQAVRINQLFEDSLSALERVPGVEAAAVSLELPYMRLLNSGFTFADEAPDPNFWPMANFMYVTPRFFDVLRIPVPLGRAFTPEDRAGAPLVAVVNETFLKSWARGVNPVGRRLGRGPTSREIVGVVGDVQVTNSGIQFPGRASAPIMTSPLVFIPAAQTSDGFFQTSHTWFSPVWTVRAGSSANAVQILPRAINSVDPLLPVTDVRSMAAVQTAALSQQRLLMTLVGVLAVAAVLLAAIGLNGVIANSVMERRREFGIRIALGATAGGTIRRVAAGGLALAAVGTVIGGVLSLAIVRLVQSFLVGVQPRDPMTYAGVALFLLIVATVASVLPALRILKLDPAETLRN